MTYKMNSSKEFSFKMPRVISQLHAAHITIYYLAFGWNSSLLTTLGKSCYIFHKIWVLDLLLKTLPSEWTHAIFCIPVVISILKGGTFARPCGGRLKEKVFIENICKSWCLALFSELRWKWKYKSRYSSFPFWANLLGESFIFFCFIWICSEHLKYTTL